MPHGFSPGQVARGGHFLRQGGNGTMLRLDGGEL
jgi:hypothetical protein